MLAGDGESFCAGGDAEWMRASAELSFDENVEDALGLGRMLEAVDGCPAPVVARVQGHAFGGGAGLVACCDVAVAHPGTVFAFSEVKLGVVPGVISPFVLAKIGTSAARSLFVTGRRFDAATALRIGLVHELADGLDAAVEGVVAELLTAGPDGREGREDAGAGAARDGGDRAPDRREPRGRRGPGGAAGVPRRPASRTSRVRFVVPSSGRRLDPSRRH